MGRRAADLEEAADLGRHLTEQHERVGSPAFSLMAKDFYKDFGVDVSDEQLREMHNGTRNPRSVKLEVLAVFTMYYGCQPNALGSVAAERLNWLRTLDTSGWRCIAISPGQLRLLDPVAA